MSVKQKVGFPAASAKSSSNKHSCKILFQNLDLFPGASA